MLRTSNNLNAASEFSRRYQTFLALTDFQVAMIFFSYVSAFVTSEVGTFWQNFWVFLPLNEKDWDLDTGISSLFTLAPGWCVFLVARCDLVCLNGLISAILAQTWAFFQASAALDGFLTLRMIVLNCDWLIDWGLFFTPSDLKWIFKTSFEVWWLVFLTRRDCKLDVDWTQFYFLSCRLESLPGQLEDVLLRHICTGLNLCRVLKS